MYEQIRGAVPLARWGKEAEIADGALFLASEAASYITGTIIETDGGVTIASPEMSRFESIEDAGGAEEGANRWYKVSLTGGKYREVRRLFQSQDLEVARLIRIRFGDLTLPSSLRTGRCPSSASSKLVLPCCQDLILV